MRQNNSAKSFLFLIELMISVLIFIWGCAICIEVFAYSNVLNDESFAQNKALLELQSVHNVLQQNDMEQTAEIVQAVQSSVDGFTVNFDNEFNTVAEQGHYSMTVTRVGDIYTVNFFDAEQNVFLTQDLIIYKSNTAGGV